MSSSLGCTKEVLQQVNQFWSMLDDLSQNDPQSYQMFIEKQMKQGTDYNAPPQPDSCLLTEMLEPKKGLLYINVCGWKRVPTPADENKPLTPGPGDQSNKTKNLIQVISSSVTAEPQRPQHQLTVNSDPRDLSRSLKLTMELPKVQSITECHLSISQDDVLLEVEDMYHLHLELPETVNEESASATFNKKKRLLTLQVSIL
uniref:PIH1D1/2/3 CS-like domain-containing protein n=1 Tax=Oncorhynchus tshawytscha TaxID=74940 RepID=A0A8C8CUW1_ONCTS